MVSPMNALNGPATKRLTLDVTLPLCAGLAEAFAKVIRYACDWSLRVEQEPEPAVHNFRKSIRRGRALLKLVAKLIPRADYDALAEELRGAMRETSAARDADVLVSLVAAYPRKPKTQTALDALQILLEEQRAAVHSQARLKKAMTEGAEVLRSVPARLQAALPATTCHADLQLALRVSHRRARRARRRARKSSEEDDVHSWRKRVKELRYQLELLAPLTGERPQHVALAALAEGLGEVTDLIVLRDCVLAHGERLQQRHQVDAEPLLLKLEKKIARRQQELIAESEALFAPKPAMFARRVLSGISPASSSGRMIAPCD
jgi:CHAD domain-containing protein